MFWKSDVAGVDLPNMRPPATVAKSPELQFQRNN